MEVNRRDLDKRGMFNIETPLNHKEILERVNGIRKHFIDLVHALTQFNAKIGLARDKNDDVAKCLMKYKQVEPFETTSQYAIQLAADVLGKIGKHQTALILRLEKNVLPNLSSYKSICKCLKGEIKNAIEAQSRVESKKKLVKAFDKKGSSDPRFRDAKLDADKELGNATTEFYRLSAHSQEQIVKFEHKRLMDLKESLESFFKIQIAYHAKSLELLTDGYRFIASMDESADLEVLIRRLNLNTTYSMPEELRSGAAKEKIPKTNTGKRISKSGGLE